MAGGIVIRSSKYTPLRDDDSRLIPNRPLVCQRSPTGTYFGRAASVLAADTDHRYRLFEPRFDTVELGIVR
jgi:hypothetical protein